MEPDGKKKQGHTKEVGKTPKRGGEWGRRDPRTRAFWVIWPCNGNQNVSTMGGPTLNGVRS